MIIKDGILTKEECISYSLRELYFGAGYKQYKMSKFEEYDLYAKNKDFLVSNEVITFTDTDGRLLALKPDVTLSIIKNGKDGLGIEKLYYDEKVYRVNKGTKCFKEITQVGVECIGKITETEVLEILYLAKGSLERVSSDYLLEITDLDIVSDLLDSFGVSSDGKIEIFKSLSSKNMQAVLEICAKESLGEKETKLIQKLLRIFGTPSKVITELAEFKINDKLTETITRFERVLNCLKTANGYDEDKIRIDFSVVEDLRYYNGLAFKGFVQGVPTSVLSGGQYDNLMKKTKRDSMAIGFAVYIDELLKLPENK